MDNRMLTAEGLKNLFWGEIIAICAVIPLLGTIAGIVGMVLSILGFVKLSRVSPCIRWHSPLKSVIW